MREKWRGNDVEVAVQHDLAVGLLPGPALSQPQRVAEDGTEGGGGYKRDPHAPINSPQAHISQQQGQAPICYLSRARAKAAVLPVIMSIIGPRETHDYREFNRKSAGYNPNPKQQQ